MAYSAITDAEIASDQPVTTALMHKIRDNILGYHGGETGLRSLFQQTAAPLGWTKETSHHDKALRVSGTGSASFGGSSAFSTVFGKTATDGKSLDQGHLPNVNLSHGLELADGTISNGTNVIRASNTANNVQNVGGALSGVPINTSSDTLSVANRGVSGTISLGGSGTAHTHDIDIRVQYVDIILAIKD